MGRIQSINLDWQKTEPGLLGLGRHAVSNDGEVAVALRDNLAPRTYCLNRYLSTAKADAEVECGATFTMDSVKHVELLPGGGFALAITEGDLYFMNTSSVLIDRTTYQPGRGMTFVDIALAAADPRRTFAILSMERTGDNYTLSVAEGTESLNSVWSKTWMTPITAIAVSCDGELFAVGLANGTVTVLDRERQVIWESLPDANSEVSISIAALCVDTNGAVVLVDGAGNVRRHAADTGRAMWEFPLAFPSDRSMPHIQTAVFTIAADSTSHAVAVTSAFYGVPRNQKQPVESSYLLIDGDSGQTYWTDSLNAPATGVAVSPSGSHVSVSCRNGDLMTFSLRLAVDSGLSTTGNQFSMAQTLYEEAKACAESGQFADAIPLLDEALVLNPVHANATVLYDEVVWHLREEAMASTTEISVESLDKVERVLKLIGYDEKIVIRRNALARLVAEKLCLQAAGCDHEGQAEEAINLYLKALHLEKNNVDIRMALRAVQDRYIGKLYQESQTMLARQEHEKAIELLEKVQDLRPDETGINERLIYSRATLAFRTGMVHYNLNQYHQAIFQFKKTVALQPEHSEAARYLRMAESAVRRTAGASSITNGPDTIPVPERRVANSGKH